MNALPEGGASSSASVTATEYASLSTGAGMRVWITGHQPWCPTTCATTTSATVAQTPAAGSGVLMPLAGVNILSSTTPAELNVWARKKTQPTSTHSSVSAQPSTLPGGVCSA